MAHATARSAYAHLVDRLNQFPQGAPPSDLVGLCYCRHKKQHLGTACDAPLGICMTFGGTARSLIAHGYARRADAADGLDLLQEAHGRRLVQFGENVRRHVASICYGCGVCVAACGKAALSLTRRPERVITPLDSPHRIVLMAIERGKLQNLVADHQALASHRAMAAILGVILRLPPLKQALASRQLQSRYLERLLA